jgi:glycerol kinase
MNLKTLDWDKPTLDALGISAAILPKIISNSEKIVVVANGFPLAGVPIA